MPTHRTERFGEQRLYLSKTIVAHQNSSKGTRLDRTPGLLVTADKVIE
jgi:hypothetical protein